MIYDERSNELIDITDKDRKMDFVEGFRLHHENALMHFFDHQPTVKYKEMMMNVINSLDAASHS